MHNLDGLPIAKMSTYALCLKIIALVLLLILIQNCYNISVDYYNDEYFLNQSEEAGVSKHNVRRIFQKQPYSKVNLDHLFNTYKNNDRDLDLNKDNIILSDLAPKSRAGLQKEILPTKKLQTTRVPCKDNIDPKALIHLKTFEDFDYNIDDTENDDNKSKLRQKLQKQFSKPTKINIKIQNDLDKTTKARFYNLEAAIDTKINPENDFIENNVCYVPQEFPCWELPILYGELGSKTKKSDVFLIYNRNLINVVDHWNKEQLRYKATEPAISHVINKWCETRPCYGDHTLCLFPNNDVSKICENGYKVAVPTILDQFSITNTLNSMRNRVARGLANIYTHLPTASNMHQITYDYDLERIAEAWLRQCLPGMAPCSALDGQMVSQLECTKYMKYCCVKHKQHVTQCTPKPECFIDPVIGCIHIWFSSAGKDLISTDIQCGRSSIKTFNTVQLLWAKTRKIGCAYGRRFNGDTRVVCNFFPGAPFDIETKLFCGIIKHNDVKSLYNNKNLTNAAFLSSLGIKWNSIRTGKSSPILTSLEKEQTFLGKKQYSKSSWGVDSFTKIYEEGWVREQVGDRANGTRGMIARLVARFTFTDESESRCDSDESIYEVGAPGSSCVERGRTFDGLCYNYRDPTPGYRLIAVAAPIALFSLILYDLFSGVVRQTVY